MNEHDDKSFRTRLLKWFGIALLLWICVALVPLFVLTDCRNGLFDCMQPSEWGDLLAGLFAPLAFAGLAVTILLQATEVRAALREARDTRMVLKEQQQEARRQAEFMEAQTIAFERQLLSNFQRGHLAERDVEIRTALIEFYPLLNEIVSEFDLQEDVRSLPSNSRFRAMPVVRQVSELWQIVEVAFPRLQSDETL
ncbi:hypothetical protein SAMN06297251_111149 [Fulvimarina manganoxydans]|uniref:Uncharacterized protein n=1 Tax=Fulvimarina manganoxydans TaxID=937218 RepID=A0A1W2CVA8_9HYPH|nr:hypothetical protein [Fulvimarina manganoxydans]SMC89197.1 hypothetical protein SAMN06297251_111149 [Fulvimarina manganoxydans]